MNRVWAFYLSIVLLVCCNLSAFAQINGRIFYDGVQHPVVRIIAFENAGEGTAKVAASTQADTLGFYNLNLLKGKSFKLVFQYDSKEYEPDRITPLVRFLTSPSSHVNLKLRSVINHSAKFLVSNVYTSGKGNDSTFTLLGVSSEDTSRIRLATSSEIGCVWGIAFDKNRGQLYSSSFAKRHVGYGPLGTGGIYRTDWRRRKTTAWLDLQRLGIQTGPDEHQGLKAHVDSVSIDPVLMKQVGKVSLGGMDLSSSADTIYVMNLYDKKLYAIHVPADTSILVNASDIKAFKLPDTQVKGGEIRPFAVKYHQGKIYVGAVSDASLSQDLKDLHAFVYELEPASGRFKQVFKVALDYNRGASVIGIPLSKWNPWSDEFAKALIADFPSTALYPQPILSSIEFGLNDEVVLGFMDRFGHLSGPGFPNPEGTAGYSGVAAGDLLRIHFADGKKIRLENNAAVDKTVTEGKNNGQGPAGGEFYYQDGFVKKGINIPPRIVHEETATGSLLSMQDSKELLASVHEPEEFNSGGIKSFYSQDGKTGRTWQFYKDGQAGTFGKANGMGSIILVTSDEGMFIGNRIWQDANGNGIQDPDENGLPNILVELWRNDKKVASMATNVNGEYLFDHTNVQEGIFKETEYQVRIKHSNQFQSAPFKVGTEEELDNDGIEIGEYIIASLVTGEDARCKHSVDLGILPRGLSNKELANLPIVYPNPVASSLSVQLSRGSAIKSISVRNLFGRLMLHEAVSSSHLNHYNIDVNSLPDGTYVIVLHTSTGMSFNKVFVKVRD